MIAIQRNVTTHLHINNKLHSFTSYFRQVTIAICNYPNKLCIKRETTPCGCVVFALMRRRFTPSQHRGLLEQQGVQDGGGGEEEGEDEDEEGVQDPVVEEVRRRSRTRTRTRTACRVDNLIYEVEFPL